MQNRGFVLIPMLLFAFIFSLLALLAIQESVIETQASSYYRAKILSLIDAENKLLVMENKLAKGEIPQDAELIPEQVCGIKFYRLTATGKAGSSKSYVQSTYVKLDDSQHCEPRPVMKGGRQGVRQLRTKNFGMVSLRGL